MRFLFPTVRIDYSSCIYSQINSGEYDSGLKIAYNPETKIVTGYFANYSGYDETTGNPRFSCIFYINGLYSGRESKIETCYPLDLRDKIIGSLKVNNSNYLSISLPEEHCGCSNVFHFGDGFADFKIVHKDNWLEIRYVIVDKSYFYKDNDDSSKRKSYLVKGDIVYIDKIEGDWIYCKYIGKSITEGWIKKETINK